MAVFTGTRVLQDSVRPAWTSASERYLALATVIVLAAVVAIARGVDIRDPVGLLGDVFVAFSIALLLAVVILAVGYVLARIDARLRPPL